MREVLARADLGAQLAEQPEALGHHVVLVDRLEVLLAGGDERVVRERAAPAEAAARNAADSAPRRVQPLAHRRVMREVLA